MIEIFKVIKIDVIIKTIEIDNTIKKDIIIIIIMIIKIK